MVFKETALFSRQICALLDDDDYARFQQMLMENPRCGDLIPATGGLRKVRLALPGRGKRGGARVIYYFADEYSQIFLLLLYQKSDKENMTHREALILERLVQELLEKVREHGQGNI